jgi:Domain of unknown function (DUF5916)
MMNQWVLSLALLMSAPAFAEQSAPSASPQPPSQTTQLARGRRSVAALRIDNGEHITLDGRLDEPAWTRALPAGDFIQQDPDNGTPATEQTEVRILYNHESLYMGVTCFDSEPDRWYGYQRRRDEFLQADDRFMWNIDTFNNQLSGYFFEMNPSGLMGDALRGPNFQNRQWDGIWNARVHHSEIGWTLEIEIPFKTLNFDPKAEVWGINFQRTVKRKNEESLWMGWARNQGLNRLSNAGQLTGLRDISEGHGLDVKPYVIGTSESFPGRGEAGAHNKANAGLDLFYSPVPTVRTNVTVNTDFAQTEVDQRLTNLTRFPTFFPEKRDFFLDGSTFFDFQSSTGGDNTLLPYFTRSIGLDANGNPQKIDLGGKLAGQFGTNDVGALYVRTGKEEGVLGEDFLVLRGKHRMFRQSYVGGLYTGRSARDGDGSTRQTAGADFLLSTSTFLGTENFSVGGFIVNTTNPSNSGRNKAFGLEAQYPNDPWNASVVYREVQDDYRAAVGFTSRTGFRRVNPSLTYTRRPRQHPWIRTIQYGVNGNILLDPSDNRTMDRNVDLTVFNLGTHAGDSFQLHVVPTFERLERNFTISRGITLPTGTSYSWNRYRLQLSTAQKRHVAVGPTLELGSFYNGTRRRVAMDVNFRVRPGLIIYTSAEWNSVDLDQGRFETRLYRVVPELQFSPWVAWVNNVQYDTQSAVLGWQSRLRWILKPGSDFYVVYTHNWLDDPLQNQMHTLDRRAASKMLYTHRF